MKKFVHAALTVLAVSSWAGAAEITPVSGVTQDSISTDLTAESAAMPDSDTESFTRPGGGWGRPGGGHPGGGHGGGFPGGGRPGGGGGWGRPGGGGHHGGGHWGRVGRGHYPRPGWRHGWRWNHHRYPRWYRTDIAWPVWTWVRYSIPAGYWQCTAFDEDLNPYSDIGPTLNQAAWNALYDCGGDDPEASGCYIPEGYCQYRR